MSLTSWLADSGLTEVSFHVRELTGQVVAEHDAQQPRMAASTTKLLTVMAALEVLGPDHRFVTDVLRDGSRLYLRGGGDPWILPQAMADLARSVQVQAVTELLLDDTRYPQFTLPPGWEQDYLPLDMQPVAPLNLREYFGFDPGRAVAEGLAGTLTATGTPIRYAGRGVAAGDVVATLQSATLRDLGVECLQASHNLIAEVLARETAIAMGLLPTWENVPAAIAGALGIPMDGLVDGSGLSTDGRLRVDVLTDLLVRALAGPVIRDGMLPLAGVTGTMSAVNDWFQDGPAAAVRGYVRAKSGTHAHAVALAGIAAFPDRPVRIFAIVADQLASARPHLPVRRHVEEFVRIVAQEVQ